MSSVPRNEKENKIDEECILILELLSEKLNEINRTISLFEEHYFEKNSICKTNIMIDYMKDLKELSEDMRSIFNELDEDVQLW